MISLTDEQMWGVDEDGRPNVMWLEFPSENREKTNIRSDDRVNKPGVEVT